jgi:hypothetical protein
VMIMLKGGALTSWLAPAATLEHSMQANGSDSTNSINGNSTSKGGDSTQYIVTSSTPTVLRLTSASAIRSGDVVGGPQFSLPSFSGFSGSSSLWLHAAAIDGRYEVFGK